LAVGNTLTRQDAANRVSVECDSWDFIAIGALSSNPGFVVASMKCEASRIVPTPPMNLRPISTVTDSPMRLATHNSSLPSLRLAANAWAYVEKFRPFEAREATQDMEDRIKAALIRIEPGLRQAVLL
jgi:hypothetical protein